MHANAFTGRVALALGVFAPAVLAQQTAVQAWIPFIDLEDEAETDDFFKSLDADPISTTGNAVVIAMGDEKEYSYYSVMRPTATVGPNTFHYEYTTSYLDSTSSSTFSTTDFLSYDCTLIGCPEATTGTCWFEESGPDGVTSDSYTLASTDLTFHALPLATPLPTPLKDSCDEDSESEEPTASRTGKDAAASGTEDEDEDEESEEGDDENAGWSVAAPLAVLVPAVVLGFAM